LRVNQVLFFFLSTFGNRTNNSSNMHTYAVRGKNENKLYKIIPVRLTSDTIVLDPDINSIFNRDQCLPFCFLYRQIK
jgi:hypothetical protein